MSWVKLDDQFHSHPKARAAGLDGRSLYIAALCWTKHHLTDGVIPKAAGKLLCAVAEVPRTAPAKLVAVGLWHDKGEYWLINDFHDYNDTAGDERQRKADHAERMREWREAKKAQRDASHVTSHGSSHVTPTSRVTSADTDTTTSSDKGGSSSQESQPVDKLPLSIVRATYLSELEQEKAAKKNHPSARGNVAGTS